MRTQSLAAVSTDRNTERLHETLWITQRELDRDTYISGRPEPLAGDVREGRRPFISEAPDPR